MAPKIQHKRSAVAGKQPQPADLEYGEIAVNYEATDPALYVKDSADAVRKIGTQPDATEAVKGIVELATAAETTTGTDATRAVHPAGLKVELDKKAPLASPALTGTPTAPTAAVGTNTTQIATTAFVKAEGFAKLAETQSFTKAQRGTPVALTDAATVAVDMALGNYYTLTLGGNHTLGAPTNQVAGQSGVIVITQDGTGSHTLAYDAAWKFPGGTAPRLTTAANAVDVLVYYVESATRITCRLLGDVK